MEKLEKLAHQTGTLEDVVLSLFSDIPRGKVLSALKKKDVKVNGVRRSSGFVNRGDKIELFYAHSANTKILFEDENVLIVYKPQGMEVTLKDKAYVNACVEEIYKPYVAVHRLDMNTEGIVILAKNERTERELIFAFKKRLVTKTYLALVFGKMKASQGKLINNIYMEHGTTKISSKKTENTSEAILEFKVLETRKICSLLEINLITGKTHQIRAQLACYGNAIVGDDRYGNKENNKKFKTHKQCLCSSKIAFNFPSNSFLNYLNDIEVSVKPTFVKLLANE